MANSRMKVNLNKKPLMEDGEYKLYEMTAEYDVNVVGSVITEFSNRKQEYESNWKGVEKAANSAVQKVLEIQTNANIKFQPFGCTAFSAMTSKDTAYMGRNYDFATNTSCVCVRCKPQYCLNGSEPYHSIAFAAVSNLEGITDPATCSDETLMSLPFICLDGINEKGVSIAVLVVDVKDDVGVTRQNVEKNWNIFTTLAIRIVLDFASSTAEAVEQLSRLNMFAAGGRDYHFFISDAIGDSRVVEYDYRKKETRDFVAIPTKIVTNFYLCDENTKLDEEPYPYFGHGHDRYIAVQRTLDNSSAGDIQTNLWSALKHSSQEFKEGALTSNTQWSVLFNNTNKTAEIAFRRKFDDKTSFSIE